MSEGRDIFTWAKTFNGVEIITLFLGAIRKISRLEASSTYAKKKPKQSLASKAFDLKMSEIRI